MNRMILLALPLVLMGCNQQSARKPIPKVDAKDIPLLTALRAAGYTGKIALGRDEKCKDGTTGRKFVASLSGKRVVGNICIKGAEGSRTTIIERTSTL